MLKRSKGNIGFPADAPGLPLQYSSHSSKSTYGKLVLDAPLEVAEMLIGASDIVSSKIMDHNYRPVLVLQFNNEDDETVHVMLPQDMQQRTEYIHFLQQLLMGGNYTLTYEEIYGVSVQEDQRDLLKTLKDMLFG